MSSEKVLNSFSMKIDAPKAFYLSGFRGSGGIANWGFRKIALALLISFGALGFTGCASSEKSQRSMSNEEKAMHLIQIGNGALISKDPIAALSNYLEAEKLDPGNSAIYHGIALAYYLREDFAKALEYGYKAVQANPKDSEANNTLGKFLLDMKRYREAEKYLGAAASDPLFKDAYKAHTSLGILHYRTGNLQKANHHFAKAISEGRGLSCVAHYYQGHIRLKQGKIKDAIREYDSATQRLCVEFADAHYAKGVALERDGQFEKARKTFLDVSKQFPSTDFAKRSIEKIRELP